MILMTTVPKIQDIIATNQAVQQVILLDAIIAANFMIANARISDTNFHLQTIDDYIFIGFCLIYEELK